MAGQERDSRDELGELQRRYLEAWQRLAGGSAPTASPWSDALAHWRRLSAPTGNGIAGDVIARVLTQGQGFVWLGDRLAELAGDGSGAGDPVRRLLDALGGAANAGDSAMRQALDLLRLPLESWQRVAESLSSVPGGAAGSGHGEAGREAAQAMLDGMRRMLSVPTPGSTREAHGDLQGIGQRWLDYQAAQQAYTGLFTGIGVEAVARLRRQLEALEARGEAVTSLRQLYHLWIDCCEEAYAETVTSDEYAHLYGRLINTLMAVRRDGQRLANDAFAAVGMPTRKELETLHRRFQEERRRARRAEAALERLRTDGGEGTRRGKTKKTKKTKGGKGAKQHKPPKAAAAGDKEKRK